MRTILLSTSVAAIGAAVMYYGYSVYSLVQANIAEMRVEKGEPLKVASATGKFVLSFYPNGPVEGLATGTTSIYQTAVDIRTGPNAGYRSPCNFGIRVNDILGAKSIKWSADELSFEIERSTPPQQADAPAKFDLAKSCKHKTVLNAPSTGHGLWVEETCLTGACVRRMWVGYRDSEKRYHTSTCRNVPQSFDGLAFTSLGSNKLSGSQVELDWAKGRGWVKINSRTSEVSSTFDLVENCSINNIDGGPRSHKARARQRLVGFN